MTESEWLACDDPAPMLRHLTREPHRGPGAAGNNLRPAPRPSPRKLRLFAVCCCRAVWGLLGDPRSRTAVETAERYADGQATREALVQAWHAGWRVANRPPLPSPLTLSTLAAAAAASTCHPDPDHLPGYVTHDLRRAARRQNLAGATAAAQAALLRDLCGNPFRPLPLAPPDYWIGLPYPPGPLFRVPRTWLTPTVSPLARAAYEDRLPDGLLDPFRLLVLADALEEAGCDSCAVLHHLRGLEPCGTPLRGPHARGCWALDLVLGKE